MKQQAIVVLRINFQGDITVLRGCISWVKWSYKKIIAVIYDWPGARNLSLDEQSGHLKSLKFHVGIPRLVQLVFAQFQRRHFEIVVLLKSRSVTSYRSENISREIYR